MKKLIGIALSCLMASTLASCGNSEEFVPTTYLVHGSHGCVNMPHDEAMELDKLITKGSKVLVKR